MRQVNRDRNLNRVPKQTHGDYPGKNNTSHWRKYPCIKNCGGFAWISRFGRERYGENFPEKFLTCKDCKDKDRAEVAAACRKLNLRKAQMGIKKI